MVNYAISFAMALITLERYGWEATDYRNLLQTQVYELDLKLQLGHLHCNPVTNVLSEGPQVA